MNELINILHSEGLTLIVRSKNDEIHRFTQRGVKDLLTLVSERSEVLKDALVADKAVGKAAASCMIVGGVKHVHADVMSEPAMALLQSHEVRTDYGTLVDHIINRSGDDWCPMERLSYDIDDPTAIINKIKDFLKSH